MITIVFYNNIILLYLIDRKLGFQKGVFLFESMITKYYSYEIIIESHESEFFSEFLHYALRNLPMRLLVSQTLFIDDNYELFFDGFLFKIDEKQGRGGLTFDFITSFNLCYANNHLAPIGRDEETNLFSIEYIKLDLYRRIIKIYPDILAQDYYRIIGEDRIFISDSVFEDRVYPYINYFKQKIMDYFEIHRARKIITENFEDRFEEIQVSKQKLQFRKAGRQTDKNYDKAYKLIKVNNNFKEAFSYWCKLENIENPDKYERDKFKSAMNRRVKKDELNT